MDNRNNRALFAKLYWLIKHRPRKTYATLRGYCLFHTARIFRALLPIWGVRLESNVRLQRNSSLFAESPSASISIGRNSIIYEDSRIEAYGRGKVCIGPDSIIGAAHIVCRGQVRIGARCLSSWNVFIQDFDSHPSSMDLRRQQMEEMVSNFRPQFESVGDKSTNSSTPLWDFPIQDVLIGDDVWLCAGVTILKGAQIGAGSIVASGSVVTKGIYPEKSLIAGNPARIVKRIDNNVKTPPLCLASR